LRNVLLEMKVIINYTIIHSHSGTLCVCPQVPLSPPASSHKIGEGGEVDPIVPSYH